MFSPIDFKLLAIEIRDISHKLNSKESAVIRTCISRLYYYVFLEARDTILSKIYAHGLKLPEHSKINIHRFVSEVIKDIGYASNNREILKVANYISELRRRRNQADYETLIKFKPEICREIEYTVEKIESTFIALKNIESKVFLEVCQKLI